MELLFLKTMRKYFLIITICLCSSVASAQSVLDEPNPVKFWMQHYLEAIRKDGFGPTVHARNMYHVSAVLYDTWLIYNPSKGTPLFLGKTVNDFEFAIEDFEPEGDRDSSMLVSMNYAVFHLLKLRFSEYSSKVRVLDDWIFAMEDLGLKPGFTNSDYSEGSPAALGVYVAELMYEFGLQEGAGDDQGYEGPGVSPSNPFMRPNIPGNKGLENENRWQPLSIRSYLDEKGWDSTLLDWNLLLIPSTDDFLTPHWGILQPFAIPDSDQEMLTRDGTHFKVHNDPGPPPFVSNTDSLDFFEAYQWNFSLVASWSGHNDPNNPMMIDISPSAIGSTKGMLPKTFVEYQKFYHFSEGGTETKPQKKNPITGKPYVPNLVKRGDYTRVSAEYWVDAVNTYSPPGHWIKMMHDVCENPDFEKKWMGKGPLLYDLEWSIKSHVLMTGALHDAAISAWSIKAYYDYIRPISAIRWMSDNGQSSDSLMPRYHRNGLPLIEGKIELVKENDPLIGENKEHLNKLKIWTWRGPDYVNDVDEDLAGVGWILAENWWPYQRYSFVTPPFAGYVSGHSCFSIAAATIMESITGSEYFPGGLREEQLDVDFLEFEKGPSEPITLQWATYREAADETCLSRIWGGIHPPVDDVEGRKVGEKVAQDAIMFAKMIFK